MADRVPLLAGNWKMYGSRELLSELELIDRSVAPLAAARRAEFVFFLPAPLLPHAASLGAVAIGGQDCHSQPEGAFTGSISAALLEDSGATWVLVGHSELRRDLRLADGEVAARLRAGVSRLNVILCVGEDTKDQTPRVVARQLEDSLPANVDPRRISIAYEPVWAIGSGETPTLERIEETHRHLRCVLTERFGSGGNGIRILYGGSVSGANAAEILAMPGVDGVLVGGSSLSASTFLPIANAVRGEDMPPADRRAAG